LVVSETSGGYEVNSASIVAGINGQTGSYVKISADTINLSGYVTASELYATDAKIDNLTSGATQATTLNTAVLQTLSLLYQGANFYSTTLKYKDHSGTNKTLYVLAHN
jgi:hypothetical protein